MEIFLKKKKNHINHYKKGIILLKKISSKFHFEYIKNILFKFGKVSRIFFVSNKVRVENSNIFSKVKGNIGWVEFLDKVDAKTVSTVLNNSNFSHKKLHGFVKAKYLKNFKWNNLVNFIKKKKKN
ncbi:hypothetical protein CMESO_233 (nucleomorph) [Chroomonas mesostigmatica CCMP1168]|uniref:RRM domain-containing protein n=1 Tax=Chroomonas mesostigmatica CCMP1168 TaxID=1195612 RepID=J7G5Q0_9CRYP|nr:hypothetical protein CMESO_233 [Chroomonas mesostigmatica CCMP1168]|mmetsp:Transcript_52742/g.128820  ORF Transcript_52742/g.128820 Transcript_52742/m.128820 type:complete len:125 (-) Transcript_52742:264-638(-)